MPTCGKKILAAQHSAAAHADQVNTGAAGVDECGNNVDIAGSAFHALLVLYPAQQPDLVAQFGRALELEIYRCLFHRGGQLVGQRMAATFEEHHRVAHVFGVDVRLDQPHARRLAAFDLVLQARTGAVPVIAVFALANEKGFLQDAQAFAYGTGTRIWAEILALGLFAPR